MTRLATAAAIAFVLAVVALHVLRPDVNPLMRGISRYAVGPYNALATVAFLLLAIAIVASGAAVRRAAPGAVTGVWLLWASAAGMSLSAIFPARAADSAAVENLPHQLSGMIFFLAAAAGTVVISRTIGRLTRLAWFIAGSIAVYFVAIGVPALGLTGIRGLVQRVCFAAIVTWLVMANAIDYKPLHK